MMSFAQHVVSGATGGSLTAAALGGDDAGTILTSGGLGAAIAGLGALVIRWYLGESSRNTANLRSDLEQLRADGREARRLDAEAWQREREAYERQLEEMRAEQSEWRQQVFDMVKREQDRLAAIAHQPPK